jgi:hypothetical protein
LGRIIHKTPVAEMPGIVKGRRNMSEQQKSKHTAGPWSHNGSTSIDDIKGRRIANTMPWPESPDFMSPCYNECRENARLIAEAGTVAAETGRTPRQLADDRAALLAALDRLLACPALNEDSVEPETAAAWQQAVDAVRKAKGETVLLPDGIGKPKYVQLVGRGTRASVGVAAFFRG